MANRLPADVKVLLETIREVEAGKDPYNTIFGNRQNRLPKPITKMTLRELHTWQNLFNKRAWVRQNWGINGNVSSASGAYQFMEFIISRIVNNLKLSWDTVFTPDLQDDLGWYLLRQRGLDRWRFGQMDDIEFGKQLAQEWASFPVLKGTRGQQRNVTRGQSYYAGDGLNKALISPERVERLLAAARAAREAEGGRNAPAVPEPKPVRDAAGGAAVGVGVGAGGVAVAVDQADDLQPILDNIGMFGMSGNQTLAAIGAVIVIVVTGVILWRTFRKK